MFDAKFRTRLIFGENGVEQIGALAAELTSRKKILLVTDPGLVAAGHACKVNQLLQDAGCDVVLFDKVKENPTTLQVADCVEAAQSSQADLLVALGGGSSLDTAKGCNFILTNGKTMRDYQGYGKADKPLLPLIAIPTTAGTGSECQSYALIADENTHEKMACGDPKAAARISILDPVLTLTQPAAVTIAAGIDTLTHALETAVTKKRNPLSGLFSRESFRLVVNAFEQVLTNPNDLSARAQMQLAAAYGGLAIENSMLGGAHAAANPLTARYDLTHGLAVGLMIPAVIRYNSRDPQTAGLYADLARFAGLVQQDDSAEQTVEKLLDRLDQLLRAAQLPESLNRFHVEPEDLQELSDQAARQWTGNFNPRPLNRDDFDALYQESFHQLQLNCPGQRG